MKDELERIIEELTNIVLSGDAGANDEQLLLSAIDLIHEVNIGT